MGNLIILLQAELHNRREKTTLWPWTPHSAYAKLCIRRCFRISMHALWILWTSCHHYGHRKLRSPKLPRWKSVWHQVVAVCCATNGPTSQEHISMGSFTETVERLWPNFITKGRKRLIMVNLLHAKKFHFIGTPLGMLLTFCWRILGAFVS